MAISYISDISFKNWCVPGRTKNVPPDGVFIIKDLITLKKCMRVSSKSNTNVYTSSLTGGKNGVDIGACIKLSKGMKLFIVPVCLFCSYNFVTLIYYYF